MTIRISIDDLPPEEALREVESFVRGDRFWAKGKRPIMHVVVPRGAALAPGIRVDKLHDWRALERRAHQVHALGTVPYERYTATLRAAWARCKKRKGKQVWVVNPHRPDRVMTYDGDGQSFDSVSQLVKEGIGDPDLKAYIVRGDEARSIWRDHDHYRRMLTRWSVFHRTFVFAVELRLEPFIRKRLAQRVGGHAYHSPATFLISNDGREYVINTDEHGRRLWRDDQVFVCA